MPSENGWMPPQASPDQCEWVTVPGTDVNLQLLKGQPSILLRAWAADWNAYIEPLRDPDSAGWTPTNAVATSNHLNGTAVDLNWDSHPFRNRGSLNADQMKTITEMEAFYEDTVFWAGRWDDPVDEMHSQMGYNSYDNPHTADVIHRKIRSDGFSTFRRGEAPAPLSKKDQYALAIIDEGRRRGITPRGIQIALATALVESNLTMYANSNDPASLLLPHDAVGSDHMSVGLFQQQNFPPWPSLECRMDPGCSAGGFYAQLEKLDYNGPDSPGSYAQTVQGSAYPDRYDQRWDEAVALYDRLTLIPQQPTTPQPTAPQPPEGVWMPDSTIEQLVREIHQALFEKLPSKSRYGDAQHLWSVIELIRNDDGFWFDQVTQDNALLNDQWSQQAIEKAISNGDQLAQAFYERHVAGHHRSAPPTPPPAPTPAPSPTPGATGGATIYDTIMALAAQMQALKQLFVDSIGGK